MKLESLCFGQYEILNLANTLNNYGCWCYLDGDHGKGRGKPVDKLDEACRILSQGYACAAMDHGADCVPWQQDYSEFKTEDSGLFFLAIEPKLSNALLYISGKLFRGEFGMNGDMANEACRTLNGDSTVR